MKREKTEIELAVATAVRCLHERGDGKLSNRARKLLRRALDREEERLAALFPEVKP